MRRKPDERDDMVPRAVNILTGMTGFVILAIFILGLAESITSGFAGWSGLPFWIIAVSVLSMAGYNVWEECLRGK